jgi:lipopolysaccharide/colanic/teichoic acid biosynthesis glycosyltransferase
MYVDRQDQSGAQRTQKNDPRVTRVGRFIRRTSIDELPQLFNVLMGEMSIVGPRPHATMMRVGDKYYFDAVSGYAARHRVKPGITGLAQVRGLRGEIDTAERARKRVEYDIYYIENWSPLLDIRIIIETVFKVFWDKNAY